MSKIDRKVSHWDHRDLYRAILKALRQLEGRLPDSLRTIDLVAAEVSREPEFCSIEKKAIESATKDLEGASQGGMTLRDASIVLHVSQAELERRLSNLTKDSTEPRRRSSFRENG